MDKNEVSILLIGDTGAGKSSFGNYYLREDVFEADDSEKPVTKDVVIKSRTIDGCTRWVIDTEGLNDGQSISSIQIQNLAKILKAYERGINAIAIIINGQNDRFSQGVKDIVKFAYYAFGTKETLKHICVVFTKCYTKTNPKRDRKQKNYMNAVKNYLSEISGTPLEDVPEIPVFFVDCYPEGENSDSLANLNLFHGFAVNRSPIETKQFKEASYREDHEEEVRTGVSKGFEERGDTTYELFEDLKRIKIIPNNKDPVRYTDWECIKSYEKAIKKKIIQQKFDVDQGYIYSTNPPKRYKVTANQEKIIIRDLQTGYDIEETPWYNISEQRTEAGEQTERIQKRIKKIEKKEVCHHSAHSLFGKSSEDHTHFTIYHITYEEQRVEKTDYDGNKTYSNWLMVPGTEKKEEVGGGMERGFREPEEKDITDPRNEIIYI